MITTLAPLGAKYKLQFVPEYSDDGATVTVAVLVTRKGEDGATPRVLSFSGTLAEVEAALAADLPGAVEKLTKHATTIEALDAELAKEVEAKKAIVKKEAEKPAAPKVAAKPAKPAAKEEKKPEAPPPAPKPSGPTPAGLQPAWKKQAPAPAAPHAHAEADEGDAQSLEELFS